MTQILDKLERLLRPVAIPNLTVFLIAGQTLFFLVLVEKPELVLQMIYVPELVMRGEVWRVLTFMLIPARSYSYMDIPMPESTNFFFFFFEMFFLYFSGTALEKHWGVARYNLFLLMGLLMTLSASLLFPMFPVPSVFIYITIFLAYAFFFPDFEFLLFFFLPMKVKWMAIVVCALVGYRFVKTDLSIRLVITASLLNLLLFLGPEIYRRMRSRVRTVHKRVSEIADAEKPFHVCTTCGKTDKTHPTLEFRYCPKCKGSPGYCSEHIGAHEHR